VPPAEFDDSCPIGDLDSVLRGHDGLGAEPDRGIEALLKITGGTQLNRVELHPELRSCCLDLLQFLDDARIGGTPQDRQPAERREDLFQQLESFGRQLRGEQAGSRDISSRPRKAGNEAGGYRIADGSHDNGNALRRPPRRVRGLGSCRHDDIDVSLNKVRSETG